MEKDAEQFLQTFNDPEARGYLCFQDLCLGCADVFYWEQADAETLCSILTYMQEHARRSI